MDTLTAARTEPTFTREELMGMPTLSVGHMDDLKYDAGLFRVWLSRMTRGDGAARDHAVTVERYERGKWRIVREY